MRITFQVSDAYYRGIMEIGKERGNNAWHSADRIAMEIVCEAVEKREREQASSDARAEAEYAERSGGGVGIEGARVIEAARRLADCSAFDVVDEMDGLRAALAALDAPPVHQERHHAPSEGEPASEGGVSAWVAMGHAMRRGLARAGEPASEGGDAGLDALDRRVEALEEQAKLAASGRRAMKSTAKGTAHLVDELAERVEALERGQSSPSLAGVRLGLEGVERRVGVMEGNDADLDRRISNEHKARTEAVTTLVMRIAALEQARNGG